ncbi:FmdB family transcriptional regulator [Frigoribacterium sp. Leaf263]|uniref:FmdB family zinc ribbon protein n=1 Tax=Frigoribacterium sp. Leaf263 TaxID=1736313 RepID=UPI0006F8B316|nr:FmdB family zinc ribbon protein [Frigoribacterium sp. Leaf263]KQO84075.1 FmdB family transcriptional regulator [Frigoribacterium sp. Leaf263]
MPTYSYRCTECDNAFDIVQSFTDDTLTVCPVCQGKLRKVFSPVGVTFNGSGFYRTDSRGAKGSGGGAGSKTGSGDKASGSGDKPSTGGSSEAKTSGGASSSSSTPSSGSSGSGSSSGGGAAAK